MKHYLVFNEQANPGRKTKIVDVCSKSSGDLLGQIKWWGSWRQYVFFPERGTLFNNGCMQDIMDYIGKLMEERK